MVYAPLLYVPCKLPPAGDGPSTQRFEVIRTALRTAQWH